MVINASSSDEFPEASPPDDLQTLEKDLRATQAMAYAAGTVKNLACQWRSFRRFSIKFNIWDWPVKVRTICLFGQYLSYTFHSAKTVRNYMSGVCKVHILCRVVPPSFTDIELNMTVLGLNKRMARSVKQA